MVLVIKNLLANAKDPRNMGSTPGSGRFWGVGTGIPQQYSCLENSMDRGTRHATVYGGHKGLDVIEGLNNNTELSLYFC